MVRRRTPHESDERSKIVVLALAIVALTFLRGPPGLAQTPFYEGKTVRILVGFTPGGSYDLWARLIATHMGKYITATLLSWCKI